MSIMRFLDDDLTDLGPLSDDELREFREFAAERKGKPASKGMIYAVRLMATLDTERSASSTGCTLTFMLVLVIVGAVIGGILVYFLRP